MTRVQRRTAAYLTALLASASMAGQSRADVACGAPADLDRSGIVDSADLATLLGAWGPCGATCTADLDGDGFVGAPDIGILLGEWGLRAGSEPPAPPLFAAPALVGPFGAVLDIEIADVDRNGLLDLVVLQAGPALGVATHLQQRSRSFVSTSKQFEPPSDSGCSVLLDYTGDGVEDLVISFDVIRTLANDGNGNFGPVSEMVSNTKIANLRACDIDGDGDVDAVGTYLELSSVIPVLRNTGGGIVLEQLIALPTNALSLDVGDLDNDGDVDIACATASGPRIYRNDSRGVFLLASQPAVPLGASSFRLYDMNDDGFLDIVASADNKGLKMLLGSGNCEFVVTPQAQSEARSLFAVLDADGDSDLDVLGTASSGYTILSSLNNGAAIMSNGPSFAAGVSPTAIAAADLDGDCRDDLFVGTGGSIALLWGQGSFVLHNEFVFDYGLEQSAIDLADIDLDGHVDAFTQKTPGIPTVYWGSGGIPTAWSGQNLFMGFTGWALGSLVDINGDQLLDIVYADNGKIATRRNLGNRQFGTVVTTTALQGAEDAKAIRWDGDALQDVLVTTPNGILAVYRSTGNGTLTLAAQTPSSLSGVGIGDIDGDDDDDVVVGTSQGGLRVLRNSGGALVPEPPFGEGGSVNGKSIAFADLDADGDLDIAFVRSYGSSTIDEPGDLSVWFNDGTGEFTWGSTLPALWKPISVSTVDYDVDGDLDVVAIDFDLGLLLLFENAGRGVIQAPQYFAGCAGSRVGSGFDLDGDGRPDFLAPGGLGSLSRSSSFLSGFNKPRE